MFSLVVFVPRWSFASACVEALLSEALAIRQTLSSSLLNEE
jgi:hypothetical protein